MSDEPVVTRADLGRRIAEARADTGFTQSRLAARAGLEPAALLRIESGERRVSGAELAAIAFAVDRPVDWCFTEPPPAVVSRRRDPAVGGFSRVLDRALDNAARDVAFLLDDGLLPVSAHVPRRAPASFQDAENLARSVRSEIGRPDGPLTGLQAAAENLGLLGFSLPLGRDAPDAACAEVGAAGVAVINGSASTGRRRFSLAHELGHHLTGDPYEPSPRLDGPDTERMLSAFAAHLLMPRPDVLSSWTEHRSGSPRRAAVAVAGRFSVSWTTACRHLQNLGLLDSEERERLLADDLRRGELLESGERFAAELDPPGVPPRYAAAVVTACRQGQLTAARAGELLHGSSARLSFPCRIPCRWRSFAASSTRNCDLFDAATLRKRRVLVERREVGSPPAPSSPGPSR